MNADAFPVFLRRGDARAEVDALLRELRERHGADADLGFHKYLFVTRADQTVVMVTSLAAPLAQALARRGGWQRPDTGAQ